MSGYIQPIASTSFTNVEIIEGPEVEVTTSYAESTRFSRWFSMTDKAPATTFPRLYKPMKRMVSDKVPIETYRENMNPNHQSMATVITVFMKALLIGFFDGTVRTFDLDSFRPVLTYKVDDRPVKYIIDDLTHNLAMFFVVTSKKIFGFSYRDTIQRTYIQMDNHIESLVEDYWTTLLLDDQSIIYKF